MLAAWRQSVDRLLGRGSAAITVPVMDGTLKPNRALDHAEVVAELSDLDDLATDGHTLYASAGRGLHHWDGAKLVELRRFDQDITALATARDGRVAVALDGRAVHVLQGPGGTEVARIEQVDGIALHAANALAFDADGLLISDGSNQHEPAQWCRDLMEHGRSGRVLRWHGETGQCTVLADGRQYAFGVLPMNDGTLFSESWRHRVIRLTAAGPRALLTDLPGYPSRMAACADGGFWLSCFVCRTQLVEFVLREDAYRKRMLAEIDPRFWIAPALSSGMSFLEPLQGAGVKQMGVLKPWAPPRSYGLVLKVGADGRVAESMHSQVDGRHHGITALCEFNDALYLVSKGSARLLRVTRDSTQ